MKSGWNRVIAGKLSVAMIALIMLTSPGIIGQGQASADVFIIEYDEGIDIMALPDTVNILQDYGNGRALVEISAGSKALSAASGIRMQSISDRTMITPGMADISFDWKKGEPEIAENLRAPDDSDIFIVKFKGPMVSAWVEQIADLGGIVHMDAARYGLIVQMDKSTKASVERLPVVDWIGDYHPAYKVAPNIWEDKENVPIDARLFDGSDIFSVVSKLDSLGATINHIFLSDNVIGFTIDSIMIPRVASLNEISQMSKDGIDEVHDLNAAKIHNAESVWYPSYSCLPQSLNGSGEIVGIQDTGLCLGEPAIAGPPDLFSGPDGNRVIRYQDRTGNSDPDGDSYGFAHGTAVATTVLSSGWQWEASLGENTDDDKWKYAESVGLLPRGELSMDGIATNFGGLIPDTTYWDDQYTDGARAMVNCYGTTGPYSYDTTSTTADTQMDADTRMILFTAGNSGPDPGTLGYVPKNGLVVAGSQNYRPAELEAWNPNLISVSSGRGDPTLVYGRIKPDIAAVDTACIGNLGKGEIDYWGFDILYNWIGPPPDEYDANIPGAGSDGDPDYFMGTSAACPNAAGLYLLCREYLREIEGIPEPPSELTKAMLIQSGEKMDENLYMYPGYDQGWGRPDLLSVLAPDAPSTMQYDSAVFTSVATWTPAFTTNIVSGDVPLKATLVWKDSPGEALNRDLDLRITAPGGDVYKGNSFTLSAPYWSMPNSDANRPDAAASGYDEDNNIEQVWIDNPETGLWTVEVLVANQPSNIPAAIVMTGDIGPQNTYDVDLTTDYPTTMHLVAGGQVDFSFNVFNFGTAADMISMSDDSPFSISYSPTGPYSLGSETGTEVLATISAGIVPPGVYDFILTGTSQGDPTKLDNLFMKIEVIDENLPYKYEVAADSADEIDPDVVTFTDSLATSHIFISYIRTTTNGNRVWIAHDTLQADGTPSGAWTYQEITAPVPDYADPKDVRISVMSGGTYQDRVYIVWYGEQIGAQGTSGWISYADRIDYSSWTTVLVDNNMGVGDNNNKRVNFLLCRPVANELLYVFEHVDYTSAGAIVGWGTHSRSSIDGGATWLAATQVQPSDTNYYYFPNGCVDENDVCWIFFYWRSSSGSERDISVRLYDGTWQAGGTVVTDTSFNSMNPSAWSTSEGAFGNRVYCSFIRDQGTSEQTVWTTYIDGDYTSLVPPVDFWPINGPNGTDVSYEDLDRGPLLDGVGTGDGCTWVAYKEKSTPYGANMHTVCSNDGFATPISYTVTADTQAKGHQMVSSLSLGGDHMYEVFHSSPGDFTDVNLNIYLVMLHYDWPADPDLTGPITTSVIVNPNPVDINVGTFFDLSANIDDMSTGFSGIQDAEYWISGLNPGVPVEPAWPNVGGMVISGVTESEIATATGLIIPGGVDGDYFYVWVHGCDVGDDGIGGNADDNWGAGNHIRVDIIDSSGPTPDNIEIQNPTGPWPAWRFISFKKVMEGNVLTILDDSASGDGGTTWDIVQWYDPTDSLDPWKSYNKDFAGIQDMPVINNTMGVWLAITDSAGDQVLTTGNTGADPGITIIYLESGWNMVGYPSSTPRIAQDTLPAEVTKVAEYDHLDPYLMNQDDPSLITMSEYNAYWVYATAATTWTVDP